MSESRESSGTATARRLGFGAVAILIAVAPLQPAAAVVSGASQNKAVRAAQRRAGQAYAIEFRARHALSYGHTFVMYGPLDAKGNFATRTVAGLHPAGEDPTPWMVGHVLPVHSETGPSDGDLDDRYVSARYRVTMGPEEYKRVLAYIESLKMNSPSWHALFYNCGAFAADIGRYMGLRAPSSVFIYPKDFIETMQAMNEGNDRTGAPSLAATP
ncbi:hypothetical protein [uncultured Methylobacterium sp.]|uniref:hypothetical protein n=1 Tax=uncultured Methylobacterium sp. TaxID=157278 RepID=UPI0035CAB8EE